MGVWDDVFPLQTHIRAQHSHLSANLSVIWVFSFLLFYSPNVAQVDATCVSAKKWNWNIVVLQGFGDFSAY